MVDYYGRWTYEPNTPEEKKCDCDRIADWITDQQYKVQTSMENLVENIILYFDCCDNYGEYNSDTGSGGYGDGFTVEGCIKYVEDTGIAEFDYYR